MDGGDSSSGLRTPRVETTVQSQAFYQCGSVQEMDDSQLVVAPLTVTGDAAAPVKVGEPQPVAGAAGQVNMTTLGSVRQVIERKKRGRPPKGQAVAAAPKQPPPKRNKEEEDVCFICFDGGSLVLCDRKGCPKAYHPACIKRDEAFFRSKAKWNCGWHICSVCQKAAHYMCYTCTYSLCKGCTKDAEFVCVRGNKGFCTTCMRTIMLIENKDMGDSEVVQVDFDDKTSWEYLFKVYWLYLKGSLSLTIDELIQAKNPWRGLVMTDYKQQSPGRNHFAHVSMVSTSEKSSQTLELKISKEQPKLLNHDSLNMEKINSDEGPNLVGCKEWASKELLEWVAHVRNGDTSMLSQFDVQALLLDYIKRNNLRDPRRKSQIICDLRLKNLFGKQRVGHIEMLKLLEYHFLINEDDKKNGFIPAGIVGSVAGNMGADQNSGLMLNQSKKRKTRKKCEEKTPQTNLDEYAAIDLHNINLIYLRRNSMEDLLEDVEKFHDKVVGSIVRIRVSCNDQKQDIYRLVQVVGTSKSAVPYKLGDKTTDVMLEVLNLNKKETTSIDAISNQEFSQEECRRLRQSIRCGLVKQWTVGEIQTKAKVLQVVRLNDVLEAEILRLNHLRDRANEKGHKRELRECIEKLQLLKMPEERQRRLTEIPEVHADPKMDPNYESEEDVAEIIGQKQDAFLRSKYSSFDKNGSQSISPKSRAKEDGPHWSQRLSEKRDAHGLNSHAKHEFQVTVCGLESGWGNQQVVMSGSETSTITFPTGNSPPGNTSEVEKIWHYRDPNGKIQGPFAMVQLRKWSTTGYFPTDMRIWTNNELDDSLRLTDALNGLFHKAYHSLHDVSRSQENEPVSDNRTLHSSNLDQTLVTPINQERGYGSEEFKSVLDHENQSLHETATHQITGVQSNEKPSSCQNHGQSSGQNCRQLPLNLDLNHKDSSSSLVSVAAPSNSTEPNGDTDILDLPSPTPKTSNANFEGQAVEKQESGLDGPVQGSQKSDLPSPAPKPVDEDLPSSTSKPMDEDLPPKPTNEVLPSPSLMPTDKDLREQIDETKQSLPPKASVPDSGPGWNNASGLGVSGVQLQKITDEWAGYSPTAPKPPVQEWDSSLVSMASLKPCEVLGDCVTTNTATDQLAHSSCQPASNISSWQAIINEPIEFSALAEESVSDLLAEVDAMESQSGLASPTSAMKCSDEMMDSCRNDCFSSIEELSPTADAGKSDDVSSNAEAQFPATVADDPGGVSQADDFGRSKASSGHSASSSEGETKSADAPAKPREAGSDIHPPVPCTMSQGMIAATMGRNRGLDSMEAGWPGVPGNLNMGWGGSPQGFPNMGWGTGMGAPWGNPSYNFGAYGGSLPWDSPRRYNGERFAGPRDWGFQGGDSGYGRGRPVWSRQSHGGGAGGGGGGGYSRAPPKGQRVCKFYESGHCKKGASCDYLHP